MPHPSGQSQFHCDVENQNTTRRNPLFSRPARHPPEVTTMKQIIGINHVGLRVRSLDVARAFYEQLGFEFIVGPIGPERVAVMMHPSPSTGSGCRAPTSSATAACATPAATVASSLFRLRPSSPPKAGSSRTTRCMRTSPLSERATGIIALARRTLSNRATP